jgi:hypothetical protein
MECTSIDEPNKNSCISFPSYSSVVCFNPSSIFFYRYDDIERNLKSDINDACEYDVLIAQLIRVGYSTHVDQKESIMQAGTSTEVQMKWVG